MNLHRGRCLVLITLAVAVLHGCKENESEPDIPPPWWILNVYVYEIGGGGTRPVDGCAHVKWRVFPQPGWSDTKCTAENRVKVWGHIDHSFTIEYTVYCEGYMESRVHYATMDSTDIMVRPGRKGPEVEVNQDVYLNPE